MKPKIKIIIEKVSIALTRKLKLYFVESADHSFTNNQ